MTEAIELGQRSQWRTTASLSTTEAHDLAARLASRGRAEAEATSSLYVRSGKGHQVPCPSSALAGAGRPKMRLYVTCARRCEEDHCGVTRLPRIAGREVVAALRKAWDLQGSNFRLQPTAARRARRSG